MKITLIFVGILCLVGLSILVWISSIVDDRWERMEARLATLQMETKARAGSRPVLRGAALPGNAWDDYLLAFDKARDVQNFFELMGFLEHGQPQAPLSTVRVWAAPYDAALELLRKGTRRAEVKPFIATYHRFAPLVSGLGKTSLAYAAAANARVLAGEGKETEALELLLDLCQYGRDALQDTSLDAEKAGIRILGLATWELRMLLGSKSLSTAGLQMLDRELKILDGGWPARGPMLRNQLLAVGTALSQEAGEGQLLYRGREERSLHSYRWVFSSRLRAASTFLRAEDLLAEQERSDGLPWLESRACSERAMRWSSDWPEPVLSDAIQHAFYMQPAERRGCLARIRILRVATRYLETGEVLDLGDPFGDRLKTSLVKETLRVCSPGWNGIDDGASQGWWMSDPDLVLQVKRSAR